MLSYARYILERRRLNGQLRAGFKAHDDLIAKAKTEGVSSADIHLLNEEAAQESWIVEDKLQQLEGRYLCVQARKYRVPIPAYSDDDVWEESFNIGGRHLTAKGYAALRAEIRKEKNERWQWWELRTKVVVAVATALTGLTGALIGWAAFFPRK